MKLGRQEILISVLRHRNWLDTEMRVSINQGKVDQYAEEMSEGSTFPPPVVFIDPKSEVHYLADGFHRVLAWAKNGMDKILAELRKGTKLDAIVFGIESNREQRGMPFGRGDKMKCIETLLRHPESCQWNQTKIANIVGCTQPAVAKVIDRLDITRPDRVARSDGVMIPSSYPAKESAIKQTERRIEQISPLMLQGLSSKVIATRVGLSKSRVAELMTKMKKDGVFITCPHCNGTGSILKE